MTSTRFPLVDRARRAALSSLLALVAAASVATSVAQASESVPIDAPGKQPRVGVSADGTVHILFGVGQALKMRSSHDGGASYDPVVEIGTVDQLMLGMRRGPQLAAGDGVLVAAGVGAVGDIVAWRSTDGGKTWLGPVPLTDKPKAAREGLFSLAAGAKGTAWATWLDLRDGKAQIFASRTGDGGRTWTANASIYRSPDGGVCECCQPQVAADAKGGVAFMWRNLVAGARDMYARTSTDGGKTFATAAKLGGGTWALNACPMDGGGIAVAGPLVETIWRRESTVFATTAAEPGKESQLATGKNGAVAIAGTTVLRVWQSGEDIMLARGAEAAATIGKGSYPTIAAVPGKDGSAIVAWEASDGVRSRVVP